MLLTTDQVVDDVDVLISLSFLQVSLAGDLESTSQISSDGVRLSQFNTVDFEYWNLLKRHFYIIISPAGVN